MITEFHGPLPSFVNLKRDTHMFLFVCKEFLGFLPSYPDLRSFLKCYRVSRTFTEFRGRKKSNMWMFLLV